MPAQNAAFDGLAERYDQKRPRYPAGLFGHAVGLLSAFTDPSVVDTGAGTGIALEGLLPLLEPGSVVHAVDVSADMVRVGRDKFPQVHWHVGEAEPFLESVYNIHLVVAAQAYQWMDRPRFVVAAAQALVPGGVCMVIQNNRHHAAGGFPAAYEDLLEKHSPNYRRDYRAIDVPTELRAAFPVVEERTEGWRQVLVVEDFVTMSSSSTQAQRAIAHVGPQFLESVRDLCDSYATDGRVTVPYVCEAYYGVVA